MGIDNFWKAAHATRVEVMVGGGEGPILIYFGTVFTFFYNELH